VAQVKASTRSVDASEVEQRHASTAPRFWPVLAAVFIAGWIGGIAAMFLWSVIGGYAVVDVLRGYRPTAGRPSLVETFALTLVGQTIVRSVVGALVLPPVLRAISGAVVGRLTAGVALLAGGFVSSAGWFLLARSGASSAPLVSVLVSTVGLLVSVAIVRAALSARVVRGSLEPSRGPTLALLLGLPALVLIAGVLAFSGFARADREERADKSTYQEAALDAQADFAQSFAAVAAAESNGPAFDPVIFGAQTQLREAADRLAAVDPPEDLDDEHDRLVEGLRSFSKGLESVEDHPAGTDLSGPLTQVDGLEDIREALLGLRAAGYRVDPAAWRATA
jgi:hypothetical protein